MDDLIKFQTERIQALEKRNNELEAENLYLIGEVKQATKTLQDLLKEWEVKDVEVVEPKPMDDKFQTPTQQLNNFLRNMYT